MTPREKFRLAYRAARLLPHINACHHATNIYFAAAGREDPLAADIFGKAMHCGTRARCGEWRFILESAALVKRAGRSGSKCIALLGNAVKFRKEEREAAYRWKLRKPYFPATKYHLWQAG